MNILKILIITIIIAISILVISFNPKMHKQIRLENANFDLVQFLASKTPPKLPPSNTIQNKAREVSGPKYQTPTKRERPSKVSEPQVVKPQPKQHPPAPQVAQPQPKQHPAPPAVVETQPSPEQQLTQEEKEEIVAWNKWRSDLQNQTMKDAHLLAPVGTKFSFSFTVDKFGNISNLRIWATPSGYTAMGLKAIRPILLRYQGQPILNFPPKSKRIIVNIEGHFYMARTSKLSSPSDYSDYERVK